MTKEREGAMKKLSRKSRKTLKALLKAKPDSFVFRLLAATLKARGAR